MRYYIYILVLFFLGSCARPIAKYTYQQNEVEAPSEITFNNESQKAESYEWDFGDGTTSQLENPSHRYLLSGKYDVHLVARKGNKQNKSKQTIIVEAPKRCLVQLSTDFGNMVIELYDDTPAHRDNFTKLIEEGFYDGLLFHRVIDGFMIQGGDPDSRGAADGQRLGTGSPGYQVPEEIDPRYVHTKGALAAARKPDNVNPKKASSGSQFYIVHGNDVSDSSLDQIEYRTGIEYTDEQRKAYLENGGTPFLDMNYTVFGRVIEGLDIIDKIAATETAPGDRPLEDVKMNIKVIK